ncbi:hypothetical protein IWW34DRAFT_823268 [Fusarium oxysporum f. sp. albedinis]|nr:hypothetical protein IWW34DRAFT_823268 [Fusarium oxysporum f. sp. albedinis]
MARSISSLRSQKDGSSRSSSTSSDSKVSSTCDRESDTSSVNSDSSELQDTSSTYSGNSTDSTTVQVDFDHRGETSPLQPPFSPRMVSEHQSRPKYAGFSNYTHDPRAIYIERRSSADSIRAVWGSPERHSEGFPGSQSSRQSDETAETHSSSCTHASGPNTAQSSPRSPSSVVTEAHGDATTTTGARPFYILVLIPTCCSDRRERTQ